MDTPGTDLDEAQKNAVAGVDVRVVEQLFATLRENLRTVFEANRFVEEQTGLHNQAGSNNLTEALSHIGILAEGASAMTYEEQVNQVAHLDDHLRRSMMEAFEHLVKARLGKLRPLWQEYHRDVLPLIHAGKVRGVRPHEDHLALGRAIEGHVEAGRKSKTATTWAEWRIGAEHFGKAAECSRNLMHSLEEAIGTAQQYRRHRNGRLITAVTATVGVAMGLGLGEIVRGLL